MLSKYDKLENLDDSIKMRCRKDMFIKAVLLIMVNRKMPYN